MKIKINRKNQDKIEVALRAAQKGHRARLCTAEDVFAITAKASAHLSALGVPKRAWVGCRLAYAKRVNCNSYARRFWRANSTHLVVQYCTTGWFLISCARVELSTRRGKKQFCFLPSEEALRAAQAALCRALKEIEE
jgi:hypothetical protein